MATGFEYKVVKRSSIGCTSGEELERVLNEHAGKGWHLKALTTLKVTNQYGPHNDALVTFERPHG